MTDGRWINETEKREANKGEGDTRSFFRRVKNLNGQKTAILVCRKSEFSFLSFPFLLRGVGLKQTTVRWIAFWLGNNFKRKTVRTPQLFCTDGRLWCHSRSYWFHNPILQLCYLMEIILCVGLVHLLEIYIISIDVLSITVSFFTAGRTKLYLYNMLLQKKIFR